MKLSEYAAKHGIQYRAAWNRFKAGKIPGAWQDESGTIIVPDETQARLNDAAVYARVSDPSKRKTFWGERQASPSVRVAEAR